MAIPKTVCQPMIFLTGPQQIRFAARLFNPRPLLRGHPFIPISSYRWNPFVFPAPEVYNSIIEDRNEKVLEWQKIHGSCDNNFVSRDNAGVSGFDHACEGSKFPFCVPFSTSIRLSTCSTLLAHTAKSDAATRSSSAAGPLHNNQGKRGNQSANG